MAATWLFALVLVRVPATRRVCLDNAYIISPLCWTFCAFETTNMQPNPLKQSAMYYGVTLVLALEFMVMLSFWGNLKWNRPVLMLWPLVRSRLERVSDHFILSENTPDMFAYSALPPKDLDLSHLSDSQLDSKLSNFKFRILNAHSTGLCLLDLALMYLCWIPLYIT
ncbi:hypothetical protein BDR07DRAFT_1463819, partial [Suillus spraguei]